MILEYSPNFVASTWMSALPESGSRRGSWGAWWLGWARSRGRRVCRCSMVTSVDRGHCSGYIASTAPGTCHLCHLCRL